VYVLYVPIVVQKRKAYRFIIAAKKPAYRQVGSLNKMGKGRCNSHLPLRGRERSHITKNTRDKSEILLRHSNAVKH